MLFIYLAFFLTLSLNHLSVTMKKEKHIALHSEKIIHEIKQIVNKARQKAYTAINSAMTEAYWVMGKRIVEEEQQGKERADYTTALRTLDRINKRVRKRVLECNTPKVGAYGKEKLLFIVCTGRNLFLACYIYASHNASCTNQRNYRQMFIQQNCRTYQGE